MEEILSSLNYNNPNFYNDNVRQVWDKIEKFKQNINESPTKNKQLMDIISLLLKLTDQVKIESRKDLEIESAHHWLLKTFLNDINSDSMNNSDVEHMTRIFHQISELKNPNRNWTLVFSMLLGRLRYKKEIDKIDDKTITKLIHSMRINIEMDRNYIMTVACRNDQEANEKAFIGYQDDQSRSQFRFPVETFFDNLGEERFTTLLPNIQVFYE